MGSINICLKIYFTLYLVICIQSAVIKQQNDNGLYSPDDNVVILTVNNFNTTIFGSHKPWIVEFYSSWCGFCQRFASHWKVFAKDVKQWNNLVGIGVVDCANQLNDPVCSQMVVLAYPTLRYFNQNYEFGKIGERIQLGSQPSEHKKHLLEALIKDESDGGLTWDINLQPYNMGNISQIFGVTDIQKDYAFLILQEWNDTIGSETIMNLNSIKNYAIIRYANKNNTMLIKSLGATELPAMYVIDKNFNILFLMSANSTSETFGKTIVQYLVSKGINVPKNLITSNENPSVEEITLNNTDVNTLIEDIKQLGDVVMQGDMETALRYSLRKEIGLRKEITGEQLQALRNYFDILEKYFPLGLNGKEFLNKIHNLVKSTDPVNGVEISQLTKQAEKLDQKVFSSPREWLACKGSFPHSRGYPCGLWKLFHYLTVNAAVDTPNSHPSLVLQAMHGYVKNFFSCADCRDHFLEMANRRGIFNITSCDESVLWLWAAHNEVNKRLAGDDTEDPAYPKIQFPAKAKCPQCYNSNDQWNEKAVLHYLKNMYKAENVQYLGSDRKVLNLRIVDIPSKSSQLLTSMY